MALDAGGKGCPPWPLDCPTDGAASKRIQICPRYAIGSTTHPAFPAQKACPVLAVGLVLPPLFSVVFTITQMRQPL